MAFVVEQQLEQPEYLYDNQGDVLYISFGPPVPAVSLAVEDWLIIRITPDPPRICGLTLVGFKRLFSQIRPDLIEELPTRVDRLKRAHFVASYSDEADTLTLRFEREQPAYYERFGEDIYLERTLVGGDIIGFKLTHYTERGTASMEGLLSAMLDALFGSTGPPSPPAEALTRAFLEHLDLPKLLTAAA